MIYLSLILAAGLGYLIGLLQNGIRVYHDQYSNVKDDEYNESVGNSDFTDFYDQNIHLNNGKKGD